MNSSASSAPRLRGKFRPPTDGTATPTLTFRQVRVADSQSTSDGGPDPFTLRWAPPGHKSWYLLTISQPPETDRQDIEASLVVPVADEWELGETRVSRIGGRSERDNDFRNELYLRIGAATVAGGRIEAAMKRLILRMSGTDSPLFAKTEDPWKTLHKKLRVAAIAQGERTSDVVNLLDWAEKHKVRDIRNDIVHAYWWDYADVGITRGRVHLDGTSELIQVTLKQLDANCQTLEWYADALDSVVDGIWLNLYLPRENTDSSSGQAQ